MGRDESGTLAALKALRREIVDPKIKAYRGRIVKTTGDGLLLEFASAVEAVRCVIEIQAAIATHDAAVSLDRRIEFRVGVNIGDIIIDGRDIFGDGVNVAARLQEIARPGGVCVSESVHQQVRDKLDTVFTDLGEQQVKNIARPVRIYTVAPGAARPERPSLTLPEKPSIAVLPFQNMSGDPEQEYFADGMVEDIISGLSRLGWLFVVARNSSFTYKGKTVDVKQVGRELGVRYVLEGSVRKAGARVRITGQLIDATTSGHIWADRFDGALEDVFDLQDRVTASVVGAIEPRLQRAEIERSGRKPTESLDAYDYFLRGLANFHAFTRESLLQARRQFQCAIELDPNYAPPLGLAAWCIIQSKTNGWLVEPEREIADALEWAQRATARGKDDPTALWSGGHVVAFLGGDLDTGAGHIDRALVLNPNLAAAWSVGGWVRVYMGLHADAIERFERAMRLSPLDPLAFFGCAGMAFAHVLAGRYVEGASWAAKAHREQPNSASSWRIAAVAHALAGENAEASEAIAHLLEIDPALRINNLGRIMAPFRRPEDSARFIEGLRKAGLPE
jgi:TolB-like protein